MAGNPGAPRHRHVYRPITSRLRDQASAAHVALCGVPMSAPAVETVEPGDTALESHRKYSGAWQATAASPGRRSLQRCRQPPDQRRAHLLETAGFTRLDRRPGEATSARLLDDTGSGVLDPRLDHGSLRGRGRHLRWPCGRDAAASATCSTSTTPEILPPAAQGSFPLEQVRMLLHILPEPGKVSHVERHETTLDTRQGPNLRHVSRTPPSAG
jgi:hypothetical protein